MLLCTHPPGQAPQVCRDPCARAHCHTSSSLCFSWNDLQEITLPQVSSRGWKSCTTERSCQRRKARQPKPLPLPTFPFFPSILSASASVSVVFGLWWCTVKAAAAICSVMKQGAAMAPKGLVYSTNLPSTHFLLRILTPNLIVKSRIDWKMQMAI